MDPKTFGRLHVKVAQTNKCLKQTNPWIEKEKRAGGHFRIMRGASCRTPTEPKRTNHRLVRRWFFLLTRLNNFSHLCQSKGTGWKWVALAELLCFDELVMIAWMLFACLCCLDDEELKITTDWKNKIIWQLSRHFVKLRPIFPFSLCKKKNCKQSLMKFIILELKKKTHNCWTFSDFIHYYP